MAVALSAGRGVVTNKEGLPLAGQPFHCRTAFRLLTGETAGQGARNSTEARNQATAPRHPGLRQRNNGSPPFFLLMNKRRYKGKGAGLEDGTTASLPPPVYKIASTLSRNTWLWWSTSAAVVCGAISAMLWKGVIRMPRLRAARCM